MRQARLFLDDRDRAMIRRGWLVVTTIVAQLAAMAALFPVDACGARRCAARRLARIGESIARRLILAMAMSLPAPKLPVLSPRARRLCAQRMARLAFRRRLDPCDVRYLAPAPRKPLLALAETLPEPPKPASERMRIVPGPGPRIRSLDDPYGVTRRLLGRDDPLPVPADTSPGPTGPDPAPIHRRIAALKDALDRADAHARRMARWRARKAVAREDTGRGRVSPLRVGLAPGQIRTRRQRTDAHEALADMAFLVRELETRARPPPHTPDITRPANVFA